MYLTRKSNIYFTMKKLLKSGMAVALAAGVFMACDKADQETTLTNEETQDYSTDVEISASFDELDGIIDDAVMDAETNSQIGRVSALQAYWTSCATIVHNVENKVTTITFDGECEDARGNTRSGQIIITREGYLFQLGGKNTAVLTDYVVNGRAVEGTRTIENTGVTGSSMTFNRKVVGGKVTWGEGDYATREVDHTLVWNGTNTTNEDDDTFALTGNASGQRRNGVAYTNTIINSLNYTKACQNTGNQLPNSGVMTIQAAERRLVTLDFGDDSCDNLVTVSVGERSRTIEVD